MVLCFYLINMQFGIHTAPLLNILQLQLPIIFQMSSTINFLIDKENLDQQVVSRLDLAESALDPD